MQLASFLSPHHTTTMHTCSKNHKLPMQFLK
jgi:hypothetical protein